MHHAPEKFSVIFKKEAAFLTTITSVLFNRCPNTTQWCGYAEHPVPATERLLEFAQYGWQNKAFKQMTFGLYCPPGTFCEEVRVRLYDGEDVLVLCLNRRNAVAVSRSTYWPNGKMLWWMCVLESNRNWRGGEAY